MATDAWAQPWAVIPGRVPGTCDVKPVCMCGDTMTVTVKTDDWCAYNAGELVQRAFPYLSIDDRERIVTGTCERCWAALYAIDEGDDDGQD